MTPETSIHAYAAGAWARNSARSALWYYGRGMSYGELARRVDGTARGLAALGVGRGTVVTIHLPNCPQAVMAVYAVAKLGGICDMAHPLIPMEGLAEDMAQTGSGVLITGGQVDRAGAEAFAHAVLLADLSAHMGAAAGLAFRLKSGPRRKPGEISFEALETSSGPADFPPPGDLADEPAAYLHSSGTTDRPKTVVHSHRTLNSWVDDSIDFYRGRGLEDQRLLAVLPVFHGSGLVLDMHRLLCGGGELDILSAFRPEQTLRILRRRRITQMTGVPAFYRRLLGLPGFRAEELPALRECYISGDRVGTELKEAFARRFGGRAALYEGYGMTETVTACCSNGAYRCKPESSGCPLKGCGAAVLDGGGRVLPEGEGELLLSANTMMLGYLNDPEATRAAFLTHGGRRWLRTGDWGRVDGDGFVYFRDRVKNTIVRKGYNIFPAQVEDAVSSAPGVAEACVVGVPDGETQAVRAYVVLAPGHGKEETEAAVRAACARLLPPYARPGGVRFLPELPRNRMAKVDRRALERLP